ncbi:indole-3-glycerol phosphate synthase TrpC [Aerococcus agrisoli]|uniref:Indole-3-glycerol phosphate synthase n=1 Tax=Aerococcus agrisoli TaxID=2487350 RepID=A0A3N4GNI5_9LACT|nr:indole-3-glycerol phosphate synthase TrpC [Aerococcus agrisoli]RPA60701.1 indole-3-glycerol phosphate synthase TrpC [Aerococcus agrisoli]
MILDKIVVSTEIRVDQAKAAVPLEEMKARALAKPINQDFPFEKALVEEGIGFICEVKKSSPSKGLISEDFNYLQIARQYENAGANAISVLTEPDFFQGSNQFLTDIKNEIGLPILRKDFVIDAYQIYEAKAIGADAVLLIVAILDDKQLRDYFQLAQDLGLSALVEAHSVEELERALAISPRLIGVNNRDLKTFKVKLSNSVKMRNRVPEDILFIAESGIKTREDVAVLEEGHVDGILIGETMMLAPDKPRKLAELRGVSYD